MTEPASIPAAVATSWVGARLKQAGLDQSSAQARILVAHCAGVEPGELWRAPALDAAAGATLDALVARRIAGEPVQHLTGEAWFCDRGFAVGPEVFIPRPETELLALWGVEVLLDRPVDRRTAVDLGTGSGAIAATLAARVEGAVVKAVELSRVAHRWAEQNLAGLGVELRHGDLATSFPELDGRVDLVISNPPYVPAGLRESLPDDVLRDPAEALFSGVDGLDAPRAVVGTARRLLAEQGWVGLEHTEEQGDRVRAELVERGFDRVETRPDLAGRDRFTVGRRAW